MGTKLRLSKSATLLRVALVCAALFSFAQAPARGAENGAAVLKSVKFTGLKVFGAGRLKKEMDTRFPSWLPFTRDPKFEEDTLKNDMRNIENFYFANGYFDASASYDITRSEKNNHVAAVINVEEGKPSIVGHVSLTTQGNDWKLRGELAGTILVGEGQRFSYDLYALSKDKAAEYLAAHGYGCAEVKGRVLVDRNKHNADITIDVKEGPLQSFGEISVNGNKIVKSRDILDEVQFAQGELYSKPKIDMSRTKIFSLGIFNTVSVTPVLSSSSAVVPVEIKVAEGKPRQVRVGFGYGPETKFRTQAQWAHYYIWDGPRILTIGGNYSALEQSGSVSLYQPRFIDKKSDLTITGTLGTEEDVSFTNEKLSGQFQVRRTLNPNSSLVATYNAETDRLLSLSDIQPQDIAASEPGSSYFISSVIFGYNLLFVDEPSYPSHGLAVSAFVEPASFMLGSQVDYLKGVIESHLYGLIVKDWIIALRGKFGFIRPFRYTKVVPIFKRFFSGGSYSVRGYGYQQVGPRDTAGNPVGGEYLAEGGAELRFPVLGKLKGVLFVDGGNVYETDLDFSFHDLSYGVGTGIRYVTPIGPLGIDLAFPVENLTGINYSKYSFYITIGQTL